MKKANSMTTMMLSLTLVLIAITTLFFFFNKNKDLLKDKPKDMVESILEKSDIVPGTGYCNIPYDRKTTAAMIAQEARDQGVNPQIAVKIAMVESTLSHCSEGKVITGGKTGNKDIGVMQINEGTWQSACASSDIFKIEKNIECGVKIIKTKYITKEKYLDLINNRFCPATTYPELNSLFVVYADDPDKRMLRGYNGFGCESIRKGIGDAGYVEKVLAAEIPDYNAEFT